MYSNPRAQREAPEIRLRNPHAIRTTGARPPRAAQCGSAACGACGAGGIGGSGVGDVRRAIIDSLAELIASSERIEHASLVLRANR